MMGVGPGEDALDGQRAAVPAAFRQELRQRRAAGQAAEALGQGRLDRRPRLAGGGAHRAGVDLRVLARGLPLGVSPRQDLLDVQARQVLLVADAPAAPAADRPAWSRPSGRGSPQSGRG